MKQYMKQYGTQNGSIGASVSIGDDDTRVIISFDIPGFTLMRHFVGDDIVRLRKDLASIVAGLDAEFGPLEDANV